MTLTSKLGDAWQAVKERYQGFTAQEVDTAWQGLRSGLYREFISPASVSEAISAHFSPDKSAGFNKALADKLCAHIREDDPRKDPSVYVRSCDDPYDGLLGRMKYIGTRLEVFLAGFRKAQENMPVLSEVCSTLENGLKIHDDHRQSVLDAKQRAEQEDKKRWAECARMRLEAWKRLESARGGPL